MSRRPLLSIPTTAALPHSRRLPSDAPDVTRILTRLTRASLIDVALQWLDDANLPTCAPFLDGDEDPDTNNIEAAAFAAAMGIEELVETYEDFRERKGGRSEVLDRIVEGDWRHGISLHQLAMAETRVLLDRPSSLRWNAFRLAKVDGTPEGEEIGKGNVPRVNPSTFMMNLQQEVAAVARAHYYMTRLKTRPITLLRVYINDSPYNTQKSLKDTCAAKSPADGANTLWVAFPDGSPFVYVSLMTNMGVKIDVDVRSVKQVVVNVSFRMPHWRLCTYRNRLYPKPFPGRNVGTFSRERLCIRAPWICCCPFEGPAAATTPPADGASSPKARSSPMRYRHRFLRTPSGSSPRSPARTRRMTRPVFMQNIAATLVRPFRKSVECSWPPVVSGPRDWPTTTRALNVSTSVSTRPFRLHPWVVRQYRAHGHRAPAIHEKNRSTIMLTTGKRTRVGDRILRPAMTMVEHQTTSTR
jgi:hypothetical protein